MPRIVTALFKDRAQAQQALQALMATGIAQSRITAIGFRRAGKCPPSRASAPSRRRDDSHAAAPGAWSCRHPTCALFEQGLQRGCSLIAARVDRESIDEAIRVLEMFDPARSRPRQPRMGRATGGSRAGRRRCRARRSGPGSPAARPRGSTNTGSPARHGPDDRGRGRSRHRRSEDGRDRPAGLGAEHTDRHRRPPRRRARGPARASTSLPRVRTRRPSRSGPDRSGHMNRGGRVRVYGSD